MTKIIYYLFVINFMISDDIAIVATADSPQEFATIMQKQLNDIHLD